LHFKFYKQKRLSEKPHVLTHPVAAYTHEWKLTSLLPIKQ